MKGKLVSLVLAVFGVTALGVAPMANAAPVDDSRDCDKYAVVYCGTMSPEEAREKYGQKDHTKVFQSMGISRSDLNGSFRDGVVYQDGRVVVGGKTVATGAQMAARGLGGTPIGGTSASKVSVSAMGSAQTAMVKMNNGKFVYAVMKPCGNPVTATPPKEPPVKPPKEPKPDKPGIEVKKFVNGDKKYARVGVNVEYRYRIVVRNTGDTDLKDVEVSDRVERGIQLVSVEPPRGEVTDRQWNYTIPTLREGESRSFTLTARVLERLAGKLTNTVCVDTPDIPGDRDDCDKADVDVPPKGEKPPKQPPVTPDDEAPQPEEDETPAALPETGPTETALSVIGAMSLVGSAAYYISSMRRS